LNGAASELEYCGYNTIEVAKLGCKSGLADAECCKKIGIGPGTGSSVGVVLGILFSILLMAGIYAFVHLYFKRRDAPNGILSEVDAVKKSYGLKARPRSPYSTSPMRSRTPTISPRTHPIQLPPSSFRPMQTTIANLPHSSPRPAPSHPPEKATTNGRQMHVVIEYKKSDPDELDLIPGHTIFVVKRFDDGWALGIDVATSQKGVFPLVCVSPDPMNTAPSNTGNYYSARQSSIISIEEMNRMSTPYERRLRHGSLEMDVTVEEDEYSDKRSREEVTVSQIYDIYRNR
jgi:hypothetical protein